MLGTDMMDVGKRCDAEEGGLELFILEVTEEDMMGGSKGGGMVGGQRGDEGKLGAETMEMVIRFGEELDGVEEHVEQVGVGDEDRGEEAGDEAVIELEVR